MRWRNFFWQPAAIVVLQTGRGGKKESGRGGEGRGKVEGRGQLSPGAPNDNFRKNICSEDDLRSRIFGTFVVKFLVCLLLLGFSNI